MTTTHPIVDFLEEIGADVHILCTDSRRYAKRIREETTRADRAEAAGTDIAAAVAFGICNEEQMQARIRDLEAQLRARQLHDGLLADAQAATVRHMDRIAELIAETTRLRGELDAAQARLAARPWWRR